MSTNYDELIEAAARRLRLDLGDKYSAPALPLGDDFGGIVYVHGAVSRPARDLVVTDADFGRAYLTEGWARRFLTSLFLKSTVLFIGYSHNDVVMNYLARGLPPRTRRFALTTTPDKADWSTLGITAIGYPAANDHAALTSALDTWARRVKMGHLDHYARAKEIASGTLPLDPDEADYLSEAILTPAGARGFAASANGAAWLNWAEGEIAFQRLFREGNKPDDTIDVLSRWFVEVYIVTAEDSSLAMGTFARLGTVVHRDLMWEVARSIRTLHERSPVEARKWSAILTGALSTHEPETPWSWWNPFANPLSGTDLLPTLRRGLTPQLSLTEARPWFPEESSSQSTVEVSVTWPFPKGALRTLWDKCAESLDVVAVEGLQLAEQAVIDAYQLLESVHPDVPFDHWSFRRSAIEPHPQDRFEGDEDILIDALRDCGAHVSRSDSSLTARWLASERPLFRRLGLHLLSEHEEIPADDRLDLALIHGTLFDSSTKHELFRLLQLIAQELAPAGRDRLLTRILQGPDAAKDAVYADARLRRRAIFDLLEWLSRYVNDWPELRSAIEGVVGTEGDMGVREHPDMDIWLESGTWGGTLPVAVADYIAMVHDKGPRVAASFLINRDYTERNFEDPTWEDACTLVREASSEDPTVGAALIHEFLLSPLALHHQLVASVVLGWSAASLATSHLSAVIPALTALSDREEYARAVSEFCWKVISSKELELTAADVAHVDTLMIKLLQNGASSFQGGGWSDNIMRGLNTWPGFVAQYWLGRVSQSWRDAGEKWRGLPPELELALESILATTGEVAGPIRSILASNLQFLFAADPAFTTANVMPMFDAATSEFAADAWDSWLHHPRATPELLDAGLWELMVRAADTVAATGEKDIPRQYWFTLALIAISSTAATVDRGNLIMGLAATPNARSLVSFLDAMAHSVGDLESSTREELWSTWLGVVMRSRAAVGPGVQSEDEKAAWCDIAVELRVADALDAALKNPGPFAERTRFHHLDTTFARRNADTLLRLTTLRLRMTSDADWRVDSALTDLVDALGPVTDGQLLRDLAEEAVRRGLHDAIRWVD